LESRTLDESQHESVLIVVEFILPTLLPNNNAVTNRSCVWHEVFATHWNWFSDKIAECGQVRFVNEVPGRPELNRKEKGRGHVHPLHLNALCISTAGDDFVLPESKTILIGEAAEEIDVLLRDVKVRIIDGDSNGWI
jgi:hypothetical protein